MWRAENYAYKLLQREAEQDTQPPWYGTATYLEPSLGIPDQDSRVRDCALYLYSFPHEVCLNVDVRPTTPEAVSDRFIPPRKRPEYDWFWSAPSSPAPPTTTSEVDSETSIATAADSPSASELLGQPSNRSGMLSPISGVEGDDEGAVGSGSDGEGNGRSSDEGEDEDEPNGGEGSNAREDGEDEDTDTETDVIPVVWPRGVKRKHKILLGPVSPYRTPSPEIDEEYWRARAPPPRPQNETWDHWNYETHLRNYFGPESPSSS
ncbi:hypothetical protein CVT24_002729 [Panaeolus cyanescens]|uniref:Uncharacterized protein n=1 Tax=Panaeolus cyanescens TaxID=181874 RepID=A0A409WQ54_9AGAR|nr:hypothetical protein CVT24_002729 [Panaeolus cyanescens]